MKLLSNVKLLAGMFAFVLALSLIGCKKPADAANTSPTTKPATAATNTADPNAQSQATTDDTSKDASDSQSDRSTEDDASKGRRADARNSLGL